MGHFDSIKLMRRTLRAQWMLGQRTQMGNLQKRELTSKKPWKNTEYTYYSQTHKLKYYHLSY